MTTNIEYIGHFELEMDNGEIFSTEIFSDGDDLFTGKNTDEGVITTCDDFGVCIREYYSEQVALEELHGMIKEFVKKK